MHYLRRKIYSDDPLEFWKSRDRFLLKIAREVDRLIQNPSNLAHFRKQVIVFVKESQISLGLRELNEHDVSIHPPYILAPVLQKGWPMEWPQPQKKEDLLPDYYFLLTLIHDIVLQPPQFVPINNGLYALEDYWVKCCCQYYITRATDSKEKALIETALEHVKADLSEKDLMAKKPAEKEQKSAHSKVRRIWIWLKTHPHSYGLIGGVIFLILFLIIGLLKSQWRNWCWGTAGIALLVLILSLLGGRSRQ